MTEADDAPFKPMLAVLRESQHLGFLGPVPVEDHIQHSMVFIDLIKKITESGDHVRESTVGEAGENEHIEILDLGSGGGVPGLVIAGALADSRVTLLDSNLRRCEFLRSAVTELRFEQRVSVAEGRAEYLARQPAYRHRFDLVVARSFGPPAVVAECAVGFLSDGGSLLVSEPRIDTPNRWSVDGLRELGLQIDDRSRSRMGSIQRLRSIDECSERFPRRTGIPAKRPLF